MFAALKILSPEGNCESSAREGPLDYLSILIYMSLRSKNRSFDFGMVICLFEIHENLYPPMGTAKAVPERVQLTVFPFYMWLTNQNWVFKNNLLNPTFWKSRKPSSPEGKCESTPDVVQLIFLWFIVIRHLCTNNGVLILMRIFTHKIRKKHLLCG